MNRRRFEHLILEVSLAVGKTVPRYRLWLRLHDLGWNPEELACKEVLAFCAAGLAIFLAELGLKLAPRDARRVRKAIARFDPEVLSPYERVSTG